MRKSPTLYASKHFKLLVIGGGAGGLGAASKFARKLPNGSVGIVEPREDHYYQPGFTLVGGGLMTLEANRRRQETLIPRNSTWIRDKVESFEPSENLVKLRSGEEVTYDFMVVAMGIQLRFDMIKGAKEALETPGVCSNYSPFYVEKTFREASNFKGGNAVFTFPNTQIKCAGAPQKACYITDSILRQRGVRDKSNVIYATSLKRLFGIESYLKSLEKVAKDKEIDVRTRRNLIEVNSDRKIATFEFLDEDSKPTGQIEHIEYNLLHIGPPCAAPDALRTSSLADKNGFLDVDSGTLQSKTHPNIFGVGDCLNTPNAKSAASVSSHLKTVEKNLTQVMNGKQPCMQLFGIESYLKSLEKVAKEKEIDVRTRRNLIEVNSDRKIATFEFLDEDSKPTGQIEHIEYNLLHIGPPCAAPDALRTSSLADKNGFLDVDSGTLQSTFYPNIFGVGDCLNTPNAKSAASVSSHLKTVEKNLTQVMNGKQPYMQYDGYASCPLVVSTNRVILAEFNSKGALETTPFDQHKPTYWAYLMKRYLMPMLYWNGLIKGYWNGPGTIRNCSRMIRKK